MTSLTLDNLNLIYSGTDDHAVSEFALHVNSSEFITLLGPSGCGKTSTLKMIAGLIAPDSGDILFDGQSVSHLPPEKRRAAMVFQNHLLFPYLTVRQNVGFGLKMKRTAPHEIDRKVNDMLEKVQLREQAESKPHQISGGQRQRAALARALVTEPQLLLLDEPLSSLDAHLRDEMRNMILSLQRQSGTTTVMVTHDQDEALKISDRIALMFDGELSQFDYPAAFFERPSNIKTAQFFGCQNFLRGKVVGRTMLCALGEIQLPTNIPTSTANSSELKGTATFRAESLIINPSVKSENFCEAELLTIEFAGSYRDCRMKVKMCNGKPVKPAAQQPDNEKTHQGEAGMLHVHCHARDIAGLAIGATVRLRIPPEAIWVMPA